MKNTTSSSKSTPLYSFSFFKLFVILAFAGALAYCTPLTKSGVITLASSFACMFYTGIVGFPGERNHRDELFLWMLLVGIVVALVCCLTPLGSAVVAGSVAFTFATFASGKKPLPIEIPEETETGS